MQAALASRKERLSAKRRIIQGKHVLSVVEIRDAVIAAEKATKKARAKSKMEKKRKAEVIEESSDEDKSYSEHEMDQEVGILDCIAVEL